MNLSDMKLITVKLNAGETLKGKLSAATDEFLTKAVPAGTTVTVNIQISWTLEGF